MLKIGQYNRLKINRLTDFGAYLDGGNGVEILIPSRYLSGVPAPGDEIDVFVYNDSEDRLIATTETPAVAVGDFGFLRVVDVNPRMGAFLDWGISGKDLLCPFNEQRDRMMRDKYYLVYAYLDYATKRIVASSKIEKFLGNTFPEYEAHQKVNVLVWQRVDIGYKVIVDNLFAGMLYADELIEHPEIGSKIIAYVKKVRDDGKIDVTLKGSNGERAHSVADRLIELLERNGGRTTLCDKSTPEVIARELGCSKKDFKKAIGFLYKSHRITLEPDGLALK
ncbi:MAG: GntR family transcriptional regulator [Muribaculaceae bacterium]|nr:GntR family transcriptional regulator [Muribaculaceae bacterium]MDE6316021.1 GntR family transcriptional regulator [Muribaculaceae bacterium]